MKRLIFIYSFLFISFFNAQSLKYGLTANIHRGSQAGIHNASKADFGFGLGAFIDLPLVSNDIYDSAWLYLTPQVEYSLQGERADWNEDGKDFEKYTNHYIAVPVYIKYFLRSYGYKSGIYFMLGPKFEFLVSESTNEEGAIAEATNAGISPEKQKDAFGLGQKAAQFGYGLSAAVGIQVNDNLDVFLRFDRGFSKVYPDFKNNVYNRFLAIGINYYLGSR